MPEFQSGQFGSSEFAAFRSHQDALVSSQNGRAAAQAAVLINGGAATAVLAFLSKEKVALYFIHKVPFALIGYASGVLFGSLMVYFSAQALKHWGLAWRIYSRNLDKPSASDADNAAANKWNRCAQVSYFLSMFCFIGGSVGLGLILYFAPETAAAK